MVYVPTLALTLLSSVLGALAYNSPPSGAITVGSGGKYSTLTAALKDTSSSTFFIYAGTYKEQVYITRSNIKIYGQTKYSTTYTGNTVTFTNSLPASEAGGDDPSGTVRVHATAVSLYNINIANTYGTSASHSQAIALSAYGDKFQCLGCKLTGYQDTLLAESNAQFYSNCWIEGAVDFIFGQTGKVWITDSIINTVGDGAITASGRASDDASYYVINDSTVQGTGSTWLGRPWGAYARVVFQGTVLPSNVNAAGWEQWSSSTPNTAHAEFYEYGNSGAGASTSKRASFSARLSKAVTITTVLGSGYTSWVDASFL